MIMILPTRRQQKPSIDPEKISGNNQATRTRSSGCEHDQLGQEEKEPAA